MLRMLLEKDASRMLACMRDPNVNQFMNIDGAKMTEEDCVKYIKSAQSDEKNKHFAIVDENDDWIGTISLKNIDNITSSAEYAIITSQKVHGKGYASHATYELLSFAFETLGLQRIYLNVVSDNIKANKFYRKCGFVFEGCFRKHIFVKGKLYDLNWYSILVNEFLEK